MLFSNFGDLHGLLRYFLVWSLGGAISSQILEPCCKKAPHNPSSTESLRLMKVFLVWMFVVLVLVGGRSFARNNVSV